MSCSQAWAARVNVEDYACHKTTNAKPPFYISDTYKQGGRAWDNLRGLVGNEKHKRKKFLPIGSVVYAPPQLKETYGASQGRIPVKVLYPPPPTLDKILSGTESTRDDDGSYQRRRLRPLMSDIEGLGRGGPGDIGYIHARSLERASEYVYVLNENSPLLLTKGPKPTVPIYMSMVKEGKGYAVNRCCSKDHVSDQEHCFDSYKFELRRSDDNSVFKDMYISMDYCNVFDFARPIKDGELSPLLGAVEATRIQYPETDLFNLDILVGEGLRPYLTKIAVDPQTNKGPHGSYHYKRDDHFSSDTWALPSTSCVFKRIAEKWQAECTDPGCQLQFGDLYHEDAWGVHEGHDSGRCVDIRPFRKDTIVGGIKPDDDKGLTYNVPGTSRDNPRYDRDKTRKFIQLLIKAGSKSILFNDSKVEKGIEKNWIINRATNHNNHIHVCFTPSDDTVRETCKNGLLK